MDLHNEQIPWLDLERGLDIDDASGDLGGDADKLLAEERFTWSSGDRLLGEMVPARSPLVV